MKIQNHIVRKFDNSYVVWLEEYNQWIQLEEPAFIVFEEVFGGGGKGDGLPGYQVTGLPGGAVKKLIEKYGLEEGEAERFVKEIVEVFRGLKKPVEEKHKKDNLLEDKIAGERITHTYKANGVRVRFEFATELLEYYNHHPFAHLEVEDDEDADAIFRVYDSNGIHVLKQIEPLEQEWSDVEIPGLKRRILIEFGNVIYKKDMSEWMSIIHGAVITNRKNALILSSSSGSGKSTLAALLQKEGYELASDDYIPLEANSSLIYPFPAAFSVKAGSFELLSEFYPELKTTSERKYRLTNKSLRFLPPVHSKNFNYAAFPATHLIFVKYTPETDYKLTSLKIPEALKTFTEEAWISDNPNYAERFIDWFSGLKCYLLEYSDNERVVEEMGLLLGDDGP